MPQSTDTKLPDAPARTLEELLDEEERAAWAGLQHSAGALGEDLVRASRVREHVRAHPWIALGTAAAAGFLAAPLAQKGLRGLGGFARHGLRDLAGLAQRFVRR